MKSLFRALTGAGSDSRVPGDAERVRRIAAQKEDRLRRAQRYQERPAVSFLIQSFNHCDNVPIYVERLRLLPAQEIVVCEDGSLDGSLDAWVERLDQPNDFVVRSNDLHEIRAYDRAMRLARGDLICLMQDDEVPPEDGAWLDDALSLFETYPDLVVLGGYLGFAGSSRRITPTRAPSPAT